MPSTTILLKIGLLVASFIVGIGLFYIISKATKQIKKRQIDSVLSYVINFILFIWVAKVLVHISIFIEDPFAVLAYPSNSKAIYIASVFLLSQVIYHRYRKNLNIGELIGTIIPVFLATTFTYEFLHMIILESHHAFQNLLFATGLLLLYIVMQDKMAHQLLASIIIILYSVIHIMFYFAFGYTIVYGYMLHPVYFVSIIIFVIAMLIFKRSGRTSFL